MDSLSPHRYCNMCVCSNEGDGVKDGVGVLQTKALLGAQKKWVTACWPTMAQLCGWGCHHSSVDKLCFDKPKLNEFICINIILYCLQI